MEVDAIWSSSRASNGYTHETVSLAGLNRSFDNYAAGGGTDELRGTSGNDALIYDTTGSAKDPDSAHYAGIETFNMGAGDDVLDLTSARDGASSYATAASIFGDATNAPAAGDDVLWGGEGGDTIYGDSLNVANPCGSDRLHGGGGDDTLYGDARSLISTAKGGNDVVDGGTGDDTLYGDALNIGSSVTRGHDTFAFDGPGSGRDTIGDFQHAVDHVQLKASYGYASGAAALAHTTDTGAGGFALVDLGHGDAITLTGLHKADLTASDFTIA